MAQNDIYLVRQKADGTFEEIAHSPFQYDAANITDLPDKANNTFHINTKLRVDELEVNGKTTVIHTDTNTSEQLLVTNDGTGPAAVINQLGQHPLIDIQDDGHSALFIRGDAPFGGFVGLGTITPDEQLHLTGSILLENQQLLMAKNISNTKVNILGMTNEDITNLNNVGNGITMSVGASTASPHLFMHPTGKVGLGVETNEPDGLLELKRDGERNLLFSHKTASILADIDVNKPDDKVSFKTITDHDLSFGTNALDFLTLSKEGNLTLEKKLSGSTLTGGDLTIDGNFTSNGDMVSIGSEEILFSKSLTSSGTNIAKSYRILEVGYNTQHWDHGTSFIIEVYSNHYSSQGYQKYILNHTYLDTSTGGSQDGLVDKVGSRDYVLKILEHEGDAGAYEFRARLGAPEDTGVNVNNFDVALVPLYIDVTNYANVRVKVTSFNSDNCRRISVDENWGAVSADDEYKFNPLPTAEDITWGDYADLPGTLDYAFAGRQALYADVLFGDGRINRAGSLSKHQSNIQWSLKLADTDTSLTVPGKVGIGTASPDILLTVQGATLGSNVNDTTSLAQIRGSRHKLLFNEVRHEGASAGVNWDGVTYKLQKKVDSTEMQSINFVHDSGAGAVDNHIDLYVGGHSSSDPIFSTRFAGSGNVGIGTKNPSSILELAGDPSPEISFSDTTAGDRGSIEFQDGDFNFWSNFTSAGQISGNATNNLTIKKSGNVGIGTTNPDYKLHVDGGGYFAGEAIPNIAPDNGVYLGQSAGGPDYHVSIISPSSKNSYIDFSTTDRDAIGRILYANPDSAITQGMHFFANFIDSNNGADMFIGPSGNVGIGTTNPDYDLDVHGWINAQADALSTDAVINLVGSNASNYSAISRIKSTSESSSNGSSSLTFSTRDGANSINERMRIDSDGNVGIGTTGPERRLDVRFNENNSSETDYRVVDGIRIWNTDQTAGSLSALMFYTEGSASGLVAERVGPDDMNMHFISEGLDGNPNTIMSLVGGEVGIGRKDPREKLEITNGRLLVSQYETSTTAPPVIAATFFARRAPVNGNRFGSGIDIITMGENGHTSPAIRFYDTAANEDYNGTLVGDNNWIIGADDTDLSSFKISFGGGQSSTKPSGIVDATSRLSIDGATGITTFSGTIEMPGYIQHVGDTNTYFGFPNTDQFLVATNGTSRFQITASSTTVSNLLQAQGGMTIATNEDNDDPELTLKRTAATSAGGNDDICDIRVGDSTLAFYLNNDADADAGSYHFYKMVNSAPIHAPVHAGNLYINDNIVHIGDTNTYFGFHNNDQWRVVTAGVERIEVSGVSTNALVSLRANTDVTGNLTISGDLTVNGDVVTLNTTNLDIEDKIIKVAKGATSDAEADGSGISFGGSAELLFQNSGNKLLAQGCSSIEMASTGPKLILKDTNSTSAVNQTGNISYQLANGTVSAEIGHMSNSNSDFQIKTVDGDIDIRPGGSGHKLEYNGSEVATRTYVDTNAYVHPTFDGEDIAIDTNAMTGAKVISDLAITVTTNGEGHVSGASGAVSTRTLTLADLGYTGATDANKYTHPTSPGNKHIPAGGSPGQFLKYSSDGTAVWAADNNTTYSEGDGGLTQKNFTTTLKNKLDGIAENATAVTDNDQIGNGAGYITAVPTNTVIDASVSGDTLTLTRQGGTAVTFTATNTSGGTGGSTDAVEKTGAQTMQGPLTISQKDSTGASLLAAGDVVAMTSASDERLKTNILKIDSALDKVCSLEGFTFDWNDKAKAFGIDSGRSEVGLSAQATEKIMPEAVKTFDNSDYKYINYEKLVPVLVEAIKDLKSEIEQLKNNCCDCKK